MIYMVYKETMTGIRLFLRVVIIKKGGGALATCLIGE